MTLGKLLTLSWLLGVSICEIQVVIIILPTPQDCARIKQRPVWCLTHSGCSTQAIIFLLLPSNVSSVLAQGFAPRQGLFISVPVSPNTVDDRNNTNSSDGAIHLPDSQWLL